MNGELGNGNIKTRSGEMSIRHGYLPAQNYMGRTDEPGIKTAKIV